MIQTFHIQEAQDNRAPKTKELMWSPAGAGISWANICPGTRAVGDREITESSLGTALKMAVIGQGRPWALVKSATGTYGLYKHGTVMA